MAFLAGVLDGDLPTAAFFGVTFFAVTPEELPAAGVGDHTPRASLGAWRGVITASLNPLRGVIRAFFEALIRMASPVAGLRPARAGRSTLANLANPLMLTGSPLATTAVMTSVRAPELAALIAGSVRPVRGPSAPR